MGYTYAQDFFLGLGWYSWNLGSVFGNLNMIRVKFRCILLPKLQFNLEVIKYSSMEKYNRPRRSLWAYSKDWIQIQEYDPNPGFSFYEDGRRPHSQLQRWASTHKSSTAFPRPSSCTLTLTSRAGNSLAVLQRLNSVTSEAVNEDAFHLR